MQSSHLLSNHVAEDSHHGGAAVVELGVELAGLLLGVLDVGSEVSDAIVSVVLGRRQPGELDEGAEGEDLGEAGGGDGEEPGDSGGDVGELEVVGGGEVAVELDVVVVDDGTDDGGHGNATVLWKGERSENRVRVRMRYESNLMRSSNRCERISHLALDGAATLESLRLVIQPSKRIVNSQRRSVAELELVDA